MADKGIRFFNKITQECYGSPTHSSNTWDCELDSWDNFIFTLNNAANTIDLTNGAIGQSGVVVLTNPSSTGSFSVNLIQGNGDAAEVLTPSGATINWPTTANHISIISYFVVASDKILINFVGSFA
jgi:hypothetical protein